MEKQDKIQRASFEHVRELYNSLPTLENEKRKRFFSIDQSLLLTDLVAMIKRNNFEHWMRESAKIANILEASYERIVPIKKREYNANEISQIKLTLHTLIALGCTIYVPFTNDDKYLDTHFGSSNVLLIDNVLTIDANKVYDENEPYFVKSKKPKNYDLFSPFLNSKWRESNSIYTLRPRRNYFTAGVNKKVSLKNIYGEFLYFLQNGKCAITQEKLDISQMQVDHIFPSSKGGSNTLINLQLIKDGENLKKSNSVKEIDQWIFSERELVDLELDISFPYKDLSDRKRTSNPFNYVLVD